MKIGNIDILGFRVGNNAPDKIYLGNDFIWPLNNVINYTTTDNNPIIISSDPSIWGGAHIIHHEYGKIVFDSSVSEVNIFTESINLSSISLPNTVNKIGTNAFMNKVNLSSIYIGDNVSEINNAAFYRTAISEISLPASLTRIGSYVFENCNNLSTIYSFNINPPQINLDTFLNINRGGVLYVQNEDAINRYAQWMSTDDYYLGKYGWSISEVINNN